MGTYQTIGTGRPKRTKRKQQRRKPKTRRRRKPSRPLTDDVLGVRCRVQEVMLLDQTLVLSDEVDGRRFVVPLTILVGRDALAQLEKGEAVWLSVRRERARVREALGYNESEYDEAHGS